MKVSVTMKVHDNFEKGDCFNCPFYTHVFITNDDIEMCPFWWREECPLELVEE